MATRHDVHLKFKEYDYGAELEQSMLLFQLLKGRISDIIVNLSLPEIHIGFHEHDDELTFVESLAEFVRTIRQKVHPEKLEVEKVDWDGLERLVRAPEASKLSDIFPTENGALISTRIERSSLSCWCNWKSSISAPRR